jgi:hypothetical protein
MVAQPLPKLLFEPVRTNSLLLLLAGRGFHMGWGEFPFQLCIDTPLACPYDHYQKIPGMYEKNRGRNADGRETAIPDYSESL